MTRARSIGPIVPWNPLDLCHTGRVCREDVQTQPYRWSGVWKNLWERCNDSRKQHVAMHACPMTELALPALVSSMRRICKDETCFCNVEGPGKMQRQASSNIVGLWEKKQIQLINSQCMQNAQSVCLLAVDASWPWIPRWCCCDEQGDKTRRAALGFPFKVAAAASMLSSIKDPPQLLAMEGSNQIHWESLFATKTRTGQAELSKIRRVSLTIMPKPIWQINGNQKAAGTIHDVILEAKQRLCTTRPNVLKPKNLCMDRGYVLKGQVHVIFFHESRNLHFPLRESIVQVSDIQWSLPLLKVTVCTRPCCHGFDILVKLFTGFLCGQCLHLCV